MQNLLQKTSKSWRLTLILLTASGIASANCDRCYTPYVGVDAQMRHISFQKNFGGNILKKRYPQGNVFGGVMFSHYIGLEAGYEFSKKQQVTRTDQPNDIVLGRTIPVSEPSPFSIVTNNSRASSKMNGWNLNLVGLLPMLCIEDNIQLIGSVGVAHLKLRVKNTFTNTETITSLITNSDPLDKPIIDVLAPHVNYKKRKAILRLASGIQYKVIDCLGLRALVTWENTAKLKAQAKDSLTKRAVLGRSAPRNSLHFGLGVFLPF